MLWLFLRVGLTIGRCRLFKKLLFWRDLDRGEAWAVQFFQVLS